MDDRTNRAGGPPPEGASPEPATGADDDHLLEDVAELGGRSVLGLGALLVGALPFLGLLLLVESRWGPLHRLDTGLADALNAAVSSSPWSVRVLSVLTDAGGGVVATTVLTATVVLLLVRRRFSLAAYVTVAGLGLSVLVPVTKALVGRARPDVALPVVQLPSNASFPSGHAMIATVTWGVLLLVALPHLSRSQRRVATVVAVLIVLTVGFTRIALGVHFVSDVVAGWGLGVAWLVVVTAVYRRWLRDRGRRLARADEGPGTVGAPPGSAA